MNYRLNPGYSVVLMSQRSNAPYRDEIMDDGVTIIYEGHDAPQTRDSIDPKLIDQPQFNKTGTPTQNGRFVEAVERYKTEQPPEKVRIYEKLFSGVWSFKGLFNLVDYQYVHDGRRNTFKFVLQLASEDSATGSGSQRERSRIIPTEVKKVVWERDGGRCVICGAEDELHFDHDIPYSRGGTSITAENVRILCARHNLSKGAKIE